MPNTVQFNAELPVIKNSDALWERAQGLIPAGTQTLAKGPTQFSKGVAPKYLVRGKDARVWDADGNEYLDYNMGIGPIILLNLVFNVLGGRSNLVDEFATGGWDRLLAHASLGDRAGGIDAGMYSQH